MSELIAYYSIKVITTGRATFFVIFLSGDPILTGITPAFVTISGPIVY
jgi:hypothetical protein